MLDGSQSGCINHPSVPATNRCKQCGQPVCSKCVVTAPFGRFCSEPCREQFEEFSKKARAMDQAAPRRRGLAMGGVVRKVIILLVLLMAVGFLGTLFDIPVVSDLVMRVRATIGR